MGKYQMLFEPHGSTLTPNLPVFTEYDSDSYDDISRSRYVETRVAQLRSWHQNNPIADVERYEIQYQNGDYTGTGIVYRPKTDRILPVFVYFHGGNFTTLSNVCYEYECAEIAYAGECVVFNFDYRLSPEHRYPVPLEDCFAALQEAVRMAPEYRADASRLAVGGDSAGSNLAAGLELYIRDHSGPKIHCMALCYPVVGTEILDVEQLQNDPILAYYLPDNMDAVNPLYASPLSDPSPEKTPPVLLVVGSCDFLLEDNLKYARKLLCAGVDIRLAYFEGAPHGFIQMVTPDGLASLSAISEYLKEQLNK